MKTINVSHSVVAFLSGGVDSRRLPSEATIYRTAYVIGLLFLIGLVWLAFRSVKNAKGRRVVIILAVSIALLAGAALHEEYHIQRAERCYQLMEKYKDSDEHVSIGEDTGARYIWTQPDGELVSAYGTQIEIEAYLRGKYANWFSGPIIRIRNSLLTSPFSLPRERGG